MGIPRTYLLQHSANAAKQEQVFSVVREYRKVCVAIARKQWRLFFNSENFNRMGNLDYIKSELSQRYIRNCAYQVDSQLKSFISNRQNDFVDMVHNSSLDKETKKCLFQINRRKIWFKKEDGNFSSDQLLLARKLMKRLLETNRKPDLSRCNMLLNANVAKITASDGRTTGFDYWIRLSTLVKGKPVMIPIKSNGYFDKIQGTLKEAVQFNFKEKGFTVSFIKDIPKAVLDFQSEKISLDFGLKSLFTCSDGKMFGKTFYAKLSEFDKAISTLAVNLQKQGIKPGDSKRYSGLVGSLKSYVKNEINRVFNRIVRLYKPKKINLEKLDFKGAGLSKRLNRILSNCGRGVINEKIKSLEEVYGIEVALHNPAYTSQECSNCHYVDKKNRKNQSTFKCGYCRRSLNADVNGALVVDYRSSVAGLSNVRTHRKVILRKIVTLFMERNPRLDSKAKCLIQGNPYFKDVLDKLKQVA